MEQAGWWEQACRRTPDTIKIDPGQNFLCRYARQPLDGLEERLVHAHNASLRTDFWANYFTLGIERPMVWIIRGGLALISALLLIGIVLAPTHFLVWLQGFAIVGVLGLYAEGERLHRVGRSMFSSLTPRRTAIATLGIAVLCVLMTINSFLKEAYFVATFNAIGVLLSLLSAYFLFSMPNRALNTDAERSPRAG